MNFHHLFWGTRWSTHRWGVPP